MPTPIDLSTVVLATNNEHKVAELADILAPAGLTLLTLKQAGLRDAPEPVEDADTFLGNALLKARAYATLAGKPCLADDSGLEVDALDGDPGVRSARFAADEIGQAAFAAMPRAERDAANNAKLLRLMDAVPNDRRTARFVCAMALVLPPTASKPDTAANADADVLTTARGAFEGRLARHPRGEHGFGYDPLLVLTDPTDPLAGKHAAELTPEQKHARSHRGEAGRAIAAELRRHRG